MRVEVDQSGKIGQTNVDTVLAFSNGESFSIKIPRQVKQRCIRELRKRGLAPHKTYMQLFAVALFLLLREKIGYVESVLIDVEYPGRSTFIKQHLYNLFRRTGVHVKSDQISFGFIGKKSPAHHLSLRVYRRQEAAQRTITLEEILAEF